MKVNHLIDFFVPENYQLTLDVDRENRTFSGKVVIRGQQVGDEIRLHAKNLDILVAKIDGKICEISQLENDEVKFAKSSRGDHKVELEFSGKISETDMHGLYLCKYELDGQPRELFATQFESHHAREVFPCVDEPAAKATFDVTINCDEKVVLGNTPIASQNDRATTFETTPKMSTYLLAFVAGDLIKKSGKTTCGVQVNVFATPAQTEKQLDFALDIAKKSIDFFEQYFGVDYPLPKSDHVALPDFSSGAMENWGLITYRETCLLADDASGIAAKKYIATVIAHELSHQWFGNLTTMKWWDDLWLNESFATIMEHIAVDAIHPEWNIWEMFETSDVIAALRRDSLSGVQSVRQNVNHPDEISTLFDSAIVYAKGGRLLKMLRAYVGENAFRKGLQKYFEKFAYQNTRGADLWKCLSDASGKDCAKLMDTWLTQSGYPVVSARVDGNEIELSQTQFFTDGANSDQIWPIPLFANDDAPEIFDTKTISFNPADIADFQLNIGNNAHFISHYDEVLRENIFAKISELDTIDRLKILNEMTLLARAGTNSASDYVDILQKMEHENNDAVWGIMSLMIGDLKRFTEGNDELRKHLNILVAKISKPLFAKLGWKTKPNEDNNTTELRSTIIGNLIFARDPEIVDEALRMYESNKADLRKIDGNLRGSILVAAVRFGEDSDFHYLYDVYKTTQDADLQLEICGALTASNRLDDIREMIAGLTNANIVRPQDVMYWFAYLLGNFDSRDFAWDWLRDNWNWVEKTFGGDKSYDTLVRQAAARLTTRVQLDEFRDFFTPLMNEPALKRAIEVGIRDIESRVEWLDRDQAAVAKKLSSVA